jgi:hypothetical protein
VNYLRRFKIENEVFPSCMCVHEKRSLESLTGCALAGSAGGLFPCWPAHKPGVSYFTTWKRKTLILSPWRTQWTKEVHSLSFFCQGCQSTWYPAPTPDRCQCYGTWSLYYAITVEDIIGHEIMRRVPVAEMSTWHGHILLPCYLTGCGSGRYLFCLSLSAEFCSVAMELLVLLPQG